VLSSLVCASGVILFANFPGGIKIFEPEMVREDPSRLAATLLRRREIHEEGRSASSELELRRRRTYGNPSGQPFTGQSLASIPIVTARASKSRRSDPPRRPWVPGPATGRSPVVPLCSHIVPPTIFNAVDGLAD
jgi:hypothetical protein